MIFVTNTITGFCIFSVCNILKRTMFGSQKGFFKTSESHLAQDTAIFLEWHMTSVAILRTFVILCFSKDYWFL